jgi:hypothetical protein
MTHKFLFDSLVDFYNAVDNPKPERKEACRDRIESDMNRADWIGAEYSAIIARKYSWDEGADRVLALPEMSGHTTQAATVRTWHDDDGDDGDFERYLMELPHMIRRKKILRAGQRAVARVIVHFGENSNIEAWQMLNKTYAACRIVDQLEAFGTRCEVVAVDRTRCADIHGNDFHLDITLKRADDPLNIGLLCTALSPWMLRHWDIVFMISQFKTATGFGTVVNVNPSEFDPNDIIIDRGECLTLEDARQKIQSLDIAAAQAA